MSTVKVDREVLREIVENAVRALCDEQEKGYLPRWVSSEVFDALDSPTVRQELADNHGPGM